MIAKRYRALALALVAALLGPMGVDAQESAAAAGGSGAARAVDPAAVPRPTVRAVRATAPITIDGRLDEPAWEAAHRLTGFIQSQPRTGAPSSQPTTVRILYDERFLYIGAICHDTEADRITISSLEQDYETHESDVFGLALDTYLDRRNSFLFVINAGGAVSDFYTANDGRDINRAWEGLIHVRTSVNDSSWVVELAIPLTTLRFDASKPVQDWGVNFVRRIARSNEESYWAPIERRFRVHTVSRAGTLAGLKGLRQGRNLTFKPYVLGANRGGHARPAALSGSELDAGVDAKYGLTPALTLDMTYRTDFSQVEVDEEQVNLTRFSLFFPERRDFFLENAGVFTFGDASERNFRMGSSLREFTLFHSRRIGLTDAGQPIPILAGTRLSGRTGRYDVGLLDMQTEATATTPSENFLAARVRRNILRGSDIGALFINRQATGDGAGGAYNRSFGVDANFRLLGNLVVYSYLAASEAPGSARDGRAGRVAVAWRDRLWDVSAFARRVDGGFTPAVGYIRRRGIRQGYATVGAHPRPRIPGINEINPYLELDYITDLSSVLESRDGTAGLGVELSDGGTVSLEYHDRFERLTRPFRIAADVTIPTDGYGFREASLSYRGARSRRVAAGLNVSGGEFYDGTRRSVGVTGFWRLDHHLSVDLSLDHNDVDLPAGSFDADVAGARVRYALSTRFFANGFVQYNRQTEQLVTNLRLDLVHAPLSDLFVVYTERRGLSGEGVLERALTLKVTKLLAF